MSLAPNDKGNDKSSDKRDEKAQASRDAALIEMIREQTEWGERSDAQRHAFRARLGDRLERGRSATFRVLVGAAAFAALAAIYFSFGAAEPEPEVRQAATAAQGAGFLSAAYYADAGADVGAGFADSENTGAAPNDSKPSGAEPAGDGGDEASHPDYWPAEYMIWADAIWEAPDSATSGTL